MSDETFKRFAIFGGRYSQVTGYAIIGDLDSGRLVYRDTHATERLEALAQSFSMGHSIDTARAYVKAANDYRGTEFVRTFELTDIDFAKILPLLKIGDYIRYLRAVEDYDPTEEFGITAEHATA